jgi:hypothetical protein
MNHDDLSYSVLHPFHLMYYFTYCSHHFLFSNDASYLWQMVLTRTGEFTLHVLESSVSHAEVSHTTPHGTAPPYPPPSPPPPPLVSIEQLLAM